MRADKFFAEEFGSRTKAQEALARGLVLRDGKPLAPSDEVREGDIFERVGSFGFVSNGGFKLERGLSVFGEDVRGMVFADLGASTGGFCDCLLQRGAKRVYCVDVGESQLAPSLAADARVIVMDGTNARYLTRGDFPEPLDGVTSDLSFISLRLVLPAVCGLLGDGGKAFVLFKPQFECGGKGLGKSGILPTSRHADLLSSFYDFCVGLGLAPLNVTAAPVRPRKNVEYVVLLGKAMRALGKDAFMERATKNL